jgi:predicted SnoaL-like aldol condensation-catalyzing enzyme
MTYGFDSDAAMRDISGISAAMTDKTNRNKAIIIEVLTSAFTKRDFAALERWFSPDYIQHNPFIPGSRAGLRGFVENLPKGRSYEPGMAAAEGDLVMIHGRYSGGTEKTLIAIDICARSFHWMTSSPASF